MFEVAFVCTGNRFRSVVAASAFLSATDGLPVRAESYGTLDAAGLAALPGAVREARALGLDIEAHRARPLRTTDLSGADLVVGFELQHVAAAIEVAGAMLERTFVLPELLELLAANGDDEPPGGAAEIVARAHVRRLDSRRPRSIREISDPVAMNDRDQRAVALAVYEGSVTVARALFPERGG